jgi:hypothetical protein
MTVAVQSNGLSAWLLLHGRKDPCLQLNRGLDGSRTILDMVTTLSSPPYTVGYYGMFIPELFLFFSLFI